MAATVPDEPANYIKTPDGCVSGVFEKENANNANGRQFTRWITTI